MKKLIPLFIVILILGALSVYLLFNPFKKGTGPEIPRESGISRSFVYSDRNLEGKSGEAYAAVVEYGKPEAIINRDGSFSAHIRFPNTESSADGAISDWAHSTYEDAREHIAEYIKTNDSGGGEINIHFDSYLVKEKFAGIVEHGSFVHSDSSYVKNIVKTFNIDIERGVLLQNSDILDFSREETILRLLSEKITEAIPDTGGNLETLGDGMLENIAIGHEGILVLIESGKYFSDSLGMLVVTLPYDELENELLLGSAFAPPGEESFPAPSPSDTGEDSKIYQSGEIDPLKPMVALTFDDGPSKYSDQILDLLEQYGARATFCVIGDLIEGRESIIERQFNLNCETIGHTWSHRDLIKLSPAEIEAQIMDTSNAIEAITGVKTKLFRPPYGSFNSKVRNVSSELGFSLAIWSIDTLDWQTLDADMVYTSIMENVKNYSVILCHDTYETTAIAMERVIPELISEGYQLVTLSELLNYYDEIPLEAGLAYSGAR